MPFALEADALQNALRRRVVGLNERLDTCKPCLRQRPASKERDCMRGQAAAASALDQPVADLNRARLSPEHQDDRSKRVVRARVSDCQRQSLAVVGPSPLAFYPPETVGGCEARGDCGAFRDAGIAASFPDTAEVAFRPPTQEDRAVSQRRIGVGEEGWLIWHLVQTTATLRPWPSSSGFLRSPPLWRIDVKTVSADSRFPVRSYPHEMAARIRSYGVRGASRDRPTPA